MIGIPRLRALARPIGREARAFLATLLAAFVAPALSFVGSAVVAVVVERACLCVPRAFLAALRTILVAPAAVPPSVTVPAAVVLLASLPALFLAPSTFVVTFHVAISFL